jgi:hypothetical protein
MLGKIDSQLMTFKKKLLQTKNKGHKERKKNIFFRNRQRKIIFNNVAKRSFKKVFVFRFVDNRILIINLNDFFRLFVLNKIIFKLPKNIPQCKTVEQRFFASRKFLKFFLGKKKLKLKLGGVSFNFLRFLTT